MPASLIPLRLLFFTLPLSCMHVVNSFYIKGESFTLENPILSTLHPYHTSFWIIYYYWKYTTSSSLSLFHMSTTLAEEILLHIPRICVCVCVYRGVEVFVPWLPVWMPDVSGELGSGETWLPGDPFCILLSPDNLLALRFPSTGDGWPSSTAFCEHQQLSTLILKWKQHEKL